jgi:hypothetical protein
MKTGLTDTPLPIHARIPAVCSRQLSATVLPSFEYRTLLLTTFVIPVVSTPCLIWFQPRVGQHRIISRIPIPSRSPSSMTQSVFYTTTRIADRQNSPTFHEHSCIRATSHDSLTRATHDDARNAPLAPIDTGTDRVTPVDAPPACPDDGLRGPAKPPFGQADLLSPRRC